MYAQFSLDPQPLSFNPVVLSDKITGAGKGRKVCLVSDTSADAPPTADQVARLLVKDDWSVTLLDLSRFKSPKYSPHFNAEAVAGAHGLPGLPYDHVMLKGKFRESNWYTPMKALCVYHWLKDKEFSLIIFQQDFGAGHFCCLARSMGLAFSATPLLVLGDDPYIHWLEDAKWMAAAIRTEAEIDFMERETASRADGVFFTTADALNWMGAAHWKLPENLAVMGDKKGQPFGEWLSERIAAGTRPAKGEPDVFISVCMATYNRPEMLRSAIASIEAQTYENFEFIVVDDGSTDSGVEALRNELAALFSKRKWQWIKQDNAGPSAARMKATQHAKANYFLFMDDDNTALPDELALFARASSSGADIISCIYGQDTRSYPPGAIAYLPTRPGLNLKTLPVRWIPYGANLPVNVYFNTLGDTNALFKRKVFEDLGGFQGDSTTLLEDWDLLIRAALAGYRIEVMPEVVELHFSHHSSRDTYGTKIMESHFNNLKTFARLMPPSLAPLLVGCRADLNNRRTKFLGRFRSPVSSHDYKARAIHPAFQTPPAGERINVAICTDDNYFMPACVVLTSLFLSTQKPIDVHIISSMSDEKITDIQRIAAHFNQRVHILPFEAGEKDVPVARNGTYRSKLTFARLFLPQYLPQLQKVLYLDSDLLVRRDLTDLWNFDLHDSLLGAVSDPCCHPEHALSIEHTVSNEHAVSHEPLVPHEYEQRLAERYGGDYFNAGVLLVNLEAWRRENLTEKALEQIAIFEKAQEPYFWDQSVLNRVIAGRWTALHPKWNFTERTREEIDWFYRLTAREYKETKADPHIFHFFTYEKPWYAAHKARTGFAQEYQVYEKMVENILRP